MTVQRPLSFSGPLTPANLEKIPPLSTDKRIEAWLESLPEKRYKPKGHRFQLHTDPNSRI